MKDPKCSGIFNTDPNKSHNYDPREVLAAMLFGGNYGYFGDVTVQRIGLGFAGVTVADPKTSINIGGGRVVAASANIVLQGNALSNGFYLAQSSHDLALTLIHELGHVFNIVNGLGGSRIRYDANPDGSANNAAEQANAKTLENCTPK